MKSIRKCDEKVTAQELGVKVGDKFVVLPPEESYMEEHHCMTFSVGQVVELLEDDGTSFPRFKVAGTCGCKEKDWAFETFCCLARYDEPQSTKEEASLQNVKFDMKAIAEELGVSLEKAHNIVQTALFEKGLKWSNNTDYVQAKEAEWLFLDSQGIMFGGWDYEPKYKFGCVKIEYSLSLKEEKPETIEFNGKQYNKDDVAKALELLSPIN